MPPHISNTEPPALNHARSSQRDFGSMAHPHGPAPSILLQPDSYVPGAPIQLGGLSNQLSPITMTPAASASRNVEEQDIRAPTEECLEGAYEFTADDFKLLYSIPWQQRSELWELVRLFESVSASCDNMGMSTITVDQERESRRTETRTMIAKLLNHALSQNLSYAIRQYQAKVNPERDFAEFHPCPPQAAYSGESSIHLTFLYQGANVLTKLGGFLAEPDDSGIGSSSYRW
jgi:hypothetical protein